MRYLGSMSEQIESADINNQETLSAIYDATYDRLFYYILKRCGDYSLAQDIVAETYLKAIKHLPKYQYQGKPFIAWLYRIASNELTSYFRRANKYRCVELESCPELTNYQTEKTLQNDNFDQEQIYITLRQALAKLSDLDQTIITLRFFEDKTIAEIAEIVECKVGTVKSRLSRALKKLCSILQRLDDKNVITMFHGINL